MKYNSRFFRSKKLLPYFGGKFYILKHLLPLIPEHKTYVEVFGGGATILFAKQPSDIEVYNDINPYLFNFFDVFINHFEEFYTLLLTLPYSDYIRKYYAETLDEGNNIEKAIKTYYLLRTNYCRILNRKTGFNRSFLTIRSYNQKRKYLHYFYERIKNVIVENKDFEEIILKYDTPDTFFYLDPPYLWETRKSKAGYLNEMSNEDHIRLLKLINNIKGKVMLSCYDNTLYQQYLKDWNKKEIISFLRANNLKNKPKVIETVYMNYMPPSQNLISLDKKINNSNPIQMGLPK